MLERLKEALQLTHQLARAIRDGDLDQAQAIQLQRVSVLQSAEQQTLPIEEEKQKEIHTVTLEIKELEDNLMRALSERKNDVLSQHQNQQKRTKMVKAYKDIGG